MDCNKTTNFLAELQRLCDSRDRCMANAANKEQCPMFGFCEDALTRIGIKDATKLIEAIQKWSDEHPKKTYVQDFFEKFPNAPKDKSAKGEYPDACRNLIYGGGCPKIESRIDCCYKCWNEPMNDEETKGA